LSLSYQKYGFGIRDLGSKIRKNLFGIPDLEAKRHRIRIRNTVPNRRDPAAMIIVMQEAHKMVADANIKRIQAEKRLAESDMKVSPYLQPSVVVDP
jgi:hypothetical protein